MTRTPVTLQLMQSFLRLADVFFIRFDAYRGPLTTARSMARPPPPVGMTSPSLGPLPTPAASFRRPVPWPGPRLRPHPPRPLWSSWLN
ncbi:hypothetical protein NQZ68_025955 [Dissostichus eleginoides]|nr:hypothetical protein NQZ68_025955 [Dissostichus eleginoides]